MVSGIGSAMSVQGLLTSEFVSTGSLLQNESLQNDISSYSTISDGIQTEDGAQSANVSSSGGSESSSASEMDLNGDGTVTFDEIIQYMQMQMLNEMAEGLEAETGNLNDSRKNDNVLETIKSKMGIKAYSSVETFTTALDLRL